MREFWSQFLRDMNTPAKKLIFVFLSLTTGFAGPFGTYFTMDPLERLFYWGGVIGLSIVMITAIRVALLTFRPQWSYWKTATVATLIFAISYSAAVFSITIHLLRLPREIMPDFLSLIAIVFAISISVHGIRYFTMEMILREQDGSKDIGIMRRLPEEKRGPLLRLSARDHFVDVITEKGLHTLRMRFADAVHEAETTTEGFCVHRSHWVAKNAICNVQKKNGRFTVFLRDGSVVPVSRKFQANLAIHGLLPA